MDIIHIKTWKVEAEGRVVKVATVEHGDRKPGLCEGCTAPCCQGSLAPVLTEAEFTTRKYPVKFLPIPTWMSEKMREKGVTADYIATLAMTKNGCGYYDETFRRCRIFPNCPKACLAYDCREDTRPEICRFARGRERECLAQLSR